MVLAEFGGVGLLIYIFSVVLVASIFIWVEAFTPVCEELVEPDQTTCLNNIIVYKDVDGNNIATQSAVITLITGHDVDIEANPNLIFGDFIAGAQAIGTLIFQGLSGGILFDVIKAVPFFNANIGIELIFRIITSFCGFCFIIYMITGRS